MQYIKKSQLNHTFCFDTQIPQNCMNLFNGVTLLMHFQVGKAYIRPSSAGGTSLGLLKDLRKIQTTLRKDDLVWE